MTVGGKELQLVVTSHNDLARTWMGYSDFAVMDTAYSNPIIDLATDPLGWAAGMILFVIIS